MRTSRAIALIGTMALLVGSVGAGAADAHGRPASGPSGQIVFQSPLPQTGHWQIYIEHADGSHLKRLVTSGDDDVTPSISPDGRRVVFTRIGADGSGHIFLVNIDGSGLHEIDVGGCTTPCVDEEVEGDPWSPDGHWLAFERALIDEAGNVANVGLWIMTSDGANAHQITQQNVRNIAQDVRPTWSPDGTWLAFSRADLTMEPVEPMAIFMVRMDGSDARQVTPWDLNANDPAWSPDGDLIAFQSPAEPTSGVEQSIYTIHPDGTGVTRLTSGFRPTADGRQGSNHPSWSPDGTQLVFCHFPSTRGHADLFQMNRDGSALHLVHHTALIENGSDWGPSPLR